MQPGILKEFDGAKRDSNHLRDYRRTRRHFPSGL
jgi:hypothetical protein